MGLAVGVGTTKEDQQIHYTTNGDVSLCGKPVTDVFRWSQYPKSAANHGCEDCALIRSRL
jgi:hypothetical protein